MALCRRSLTPPASLFPASSICSDSVSFVQSIHPRFITLLSLCTESLISPPCLFVPPKSSLLSISPSKSPTLPVSLFYYLLCNPIFSLFPSSLSLCIKEIPVIFLGLLFPPLSYSLHSRPSFVLPLLSTLNLFPFLLHNEPHLNSTLGSLKGKLFDKQTNRTREQSHL